MSFLTDKEILEKVKHPDNLINRLEIHRIRRGDRTGSITIPIEIKKTIAILTNDGERSKDCVKSFEITKKSVSDIRNGKVIATNQVSPELKEVIRWTKDKVKDDRGAAESLAISTMMQAIGILPDKLSKSKLSAKTVSGIAKDMAAVANQMANKSADSEGNANAVHLHLYAPRQREVEEYEIIDVN